jgi:hypothetical protein
LTVQVYSSSNGPSKESVCHKQIIAQVYKDKSEDDENADNSENTEEILEDEVNENDIKIPLSLMGVLAHWSVHA